MISHILSGFAGVATAAALLFVFFITAEAAWRNWKSWLWVIGAAVLALIFCFTSYGYARDIAIGDSIALGTGHALGIETHAVSGAGSCAIIAFVPTNGSGVGTFDHVVISAGINDGGRCNGAIRSRINSAHVVWILPAWINSGYLATRDVARRYGDRTARYACRGRCDKANFHPASYQAVAQWVRVKWGYPRLSSASSARPLAKPAR